MLREIKCPQRLPRQLHFVVDIAAGVASLTEGKFDASVSRTAKGKVTITFNEPFARAPIAVGNVVYGDLGLILSVESVSTTAVSVRLYDAAGADQDSDFHLLVQGWDAVDQT